MNSKTNTQSLLENLAVESAGGLPVKRKRRPLAATDISEAVRRRFWKNVDKAGQNQCWLWKALRSESGYGIISVSYKNTRAHRVSWIIHHPETINLEEWEVCHACDNPPCVNPEHLFLGTHIDNMNDCLSKHRFKGYKLTESKVKEIRTRYALGNVSQKELAAQFNISQPQIYCIVSGKHWVDSFDTSDNQKPKLRFGTYSETAKNSSTGVRGVCMCKKSGKFRAVLRVGDKRLHLGWFDLLEDARQAYVEANLKHFGKFARL